MTAGEFDGLTALVTGGASGIGLAVADLLSEHGATVAVLDRDITPIEHTGRVAVAADVTDPTAVDRAVETATVRLGGLDIVVNNAGTGAVGNVAATTDEDWHRLLDVNVIGIARVTRAALAALRESDHAAVVNVCSIAATAGLPDRVAYSASKGAVLAMTLAMAADHLPEGIRFNAVNPGTADTPWVQRLLSGARDPVAERDALAARQPHGRLVTAREVAHAVAHLASPLAGSTTGTWLAVDGGMDRLRLRPSGGMS